MPNKSNATNLNSSRQELIDEIEYLREKLVENKNASDFRQQLNHELSSAINLGYWEWDEIEDKPEYFSEEMALIYGVSQESLYQQYRCEEDFFHLIHPDDLDHYRSNIGGGLNPEMQRGPPMYLIIGLLDPMVKSDMFVNSNMEFSKKMGLSPVRLVRSRILPIWKSLCWR